MTVIKSKSSSTLLKEAIVLDLGDLSRQAEHLKAAAEAKARRILDDAKQQAEQIHQQALKDAANAQEKGLEEGRRGGHSLGLAQGLAEGGKTGHQEALNQTSEKFLLLQNNWSDLANRWDTFRIEVEREARKQVLELALRIADRLTHRVLEVDPSVVVDVIADALAQILFATDVSIKINPEDRPLLEETMPQLLAEFSRLKHIHLVDDPAIGRGGGVLTYGQGGIDATLPTRMRRIVELLLPQNSQIKDELKPQEDTQEKPLIEPQGNARDKPPNKPEDQK